MKPINRVLLKSLTSAFHWPTNQCLADSTSNHHPIRWLAHRERLCRQQVLPVLSDLELEEGRNRSGYSSASPTFKTGFPLLGAELSYRPHFWPNTCRNGLACRWHTARQYESNRSKPACCGFSQIALGGGGGGSSVAPERRPLIMYQVSMRCYRHLLLLLLWVLLTSCKLQLWERIRGQHKRRSRN